MSFSLYQPGDNWLQRLNPLTKLTFSLSAIIIIFGGPDRWISAILPGSLAMLALWRAGLAWRSLKLILRLLAPVLVILFLIHGLFNPDNQNILIKLGPFAVGQEGLTFASLVAVRLTAALAVSLLLVISTHPGSMIQALEKIGLPRSLAYLLGSPLLLLPQIAGRVQTIRAAQQARGLETQDNLLQRIKALFPLAAPLIFSALLDVEERSLALELRGFAAPVTKTYLVEFPDSTNQKVLRRGMLLVAIFLLVFGIWRKINGSY